VATPVVALCQNIEKEGLHVVVQSLVVQEQLGQKAEILAVDLRLLAVDLEERKVILSIDFIPRGMPQIAFLPVANEGLLLLHVLETKFTYEKLPTLGKLFWVR